MNHNETKRSDIALVADGEQIQSICLVARLVIYSLQRYLQGPHPAILWVSAFHVETKEIIFLYPTPIQSPYLPTRWNCHPLLERAQWRTEVGGRGLESDSVYVFSARGRGPRPLPARVARNDPAQTQAVLGITLVALSL
jgi:hypothetical protein